MKKITALGLTGLAAAAIGGVALTAPSTAEAQAGPSGPYQATCRDISVRGGTLYAVCQTRRAQWVRTQIRVDECRGAQIGNNDGRLQCWYGGRDGWNRPGGGWNDGRPGRPGRPGGGWGGRSEITVYVDADYRGASTTYRGEIPNLDRTGFNDRISSMRLRGSWLVCSDANFRGRCQVFDGDVRNLRQHGLNDTISSLRPLR